MPSPVGKQAPFSCLRKTLRSSLHCAICFAIFSGVGIVSCRDVSQSEETPTIRFSGRAFGTSYHITIREKLKKKESKEALTQGFSSIIERLDHSMSNWKAESEITRLNKARPWERIPISQDFQRVFLSAKKIHKKTGGYFDPGSAALFALWDFAPSQKEGHDHQHIHIVEPTEIPTQSEIRRHIGGGMNQFVLAQKKILRKTTQAKLNLSALAKGYLVDELYSFLASKGYKRILVEVGGEVRVGEPPEISAQDSAWKIGIETPRYDRRRSLLFVAYLNRNSIATSGDYRNYFRIRGDQSGTLYSHILNPKTGRPATSGVVSASVVGPECMTADALATTLLILPPKEGLEMLRRFSGYRALLLTRLALEKTNRPARKPSQKKVHNLQKKSLSEAIQHESKLKAHANKMGFRAYLSPGMGALLRVFPQK